MQNKINEPYGDLILQLREKEFIRIDGVIDLIFYRDQRSGNHKVMISAPKSISIKRLKKGGRNDPKD